MRTVAAVIALVACVHAGLWAVAQDHLSAPNIDGQLASVSYAPFASSINPDEGGRAQRRANPRRSSKARAAHARDPHLFVDRRRRAGARHRAASSACASRSAPGSTSTRIATSAKSARSSISPSATATSTASSSATKRSIAASRQVADLIKMIQRVKRSTTVPVTTGEIWNVWIEHPELVSAVDYHRRAHPALLGRLLRKRRPSIRRSCIYDKLRQAYPGKRIVIAEFGWPSAGYNLPRRQSRPHRAGRRAARLRLARRGARHRLQHHRSRSTSRGRSSKAASAPIGACSTPRASRNSPGPARSPIPTTGSSPASRCWSACCCRCRSWRWPRATLWQTVLLAAAANVVGAWFATVFAYWNGHYFVPGAAFALRPRHRAADPADRHRAGAHRGDRRRSPSAASRAA